MNMIIQILAIETEVSTVLIFRFPFAECLIMPKAARSRANSTSH